MWLLHSLVGLAFLSVSVVLLLMEHAMRVGLCLEATVKANLETEAKKG